MFFCMICWQNIEPAVMTSLPRFISPQQSRLLRLTVCIQLLIIASTRFNSCQSATGDVTKSGILHPLLTSPDIVKEDGVDHANELLANLRRFDIVWDSHRSEKTGEYLARYGACMGVHRNFVGGGGCLGKQMLLFWPIVTTLAQNCSILTNQMTTFVGSRLGAWSLSRNERSFGSLQRDAIHAERGGCALKDSPDQIIYLLKAGMATKAAYRRDDGYNG